MLLRTVVVDDENLTMELICRLLNDSERVEAVRGFTNPLEAEEYLLVHPPDVVFLDIEMPEHNGLQLAESIYESGLETEIIFVTAHNEYALEAFKVNALDYLLKPVLTYDLCKALDRVEKRMIRPKIQSPEDPKIRVNCFGSFSIRIEGREEAIRFYSAKARELLAYIVLQKPETEISKWKLIEMLWPDRDEKKGDINLRSTICRLNKTLSENKTGIKIVSKRNRYCLKAKNLTVDVLELERLALLGREIREDNVAQYEKIIGEFHGNLLDGDDFPWCEEYRTKYQRYFNEMAHKLIRYYIKQNQDYSTAVRVTEILLRQDMFDEEAHCMALRLQYLTKGKDTVKRYYTKIARLLRTELGIEPGNLRKIYDELMKQ